MGNTLDCCQCPPTEATQDILQLAIRNSPASSFTSANLKDLSATYHRLSS
jgi:hypothetical protein